MLKYPVRKSLRSRRPKGRTIYTIDYLLAKQPKALQKDPRYEEMISSLRGTPAVRQRKFNRRCYSLLHHGVIRPEHLDNFHRTYRLPRHPFFALFFQIKRQYLQDREKRKQEKEEYIAQKMIGLPSHVYQFMKALAKLEQGYRPTGRAVYFQQKVYPHSKKKVDQYLKFHHGDWIDFFLSYGNGLKEKYPGISEDKWDRMLAAFVLECTLTENGKLRKSEVKNQYRKLSKRFHPDAGGTSPMFLKIKWARDILLERGSKNEVS